MTNEAFWETTPRQFMLLAERYSLQVKREDRRAGGVIAALYNLKTRTKETDPIQDWKDFFTEWQEETEQTEEQMLESMNLWAASTKGLPS